jgi:hypothetical protein
MFAHISERSMQYICWLTTPPKTTVFSRQTST